MQKSKTRTLKGAVVASLRAEIPAMKRIYERKKQGQLSSSSNTAAQKVGLDLVIWYIRVFKNCQLLLVTCNL